MGGGHSRHVILKKKRDGAHKHHLFCRYSTLAKVSIIDIFSHIFRILSLIRSEMIDKTIASAKTIRNIQIVP